MSVVRKEICAQSNKEKGNNILEGPCIDKERVCDSIGLSFHLFRLFKLLNIMTIPAQGKINPFLMQQFLAMAFSFLSSTPSKKHNFFFPINIAV